jgi:hypothetical protein
VGKTTNAYIDKLESLKVRCVVTPFSDAIIKGRQISDEIAAQEKIMTDRHAAIIGQTQVKGQLKSGVQGGDAAVSKDPQFAAAEKKAEALNVKFAEFTLDVLQPARKAIVDTMADINQTITAFETFVNAKEKSWFGSKESVPKARAAIKSAREYATTLRQLSVVSARFSG